MREKVFSCLEKWHMTEPGMRIVVGLSGGADSVALLLLLSEYREKGQIEVEALHVHHGIRGETADRDQAFCEALQGAWNSAENCKKRCAGNGAGASYESGRSREGSPL